MTVEDLADWIADHLAANIDVPPEGVDES